LTRSTLKPRWGEISLEGIFPSLPDAVLAAALAWERD
jgi:hypothetical protein